MSNKILLKRSNALNPDGTVKLPTESQIDYGEIAVNYNKGHETLSIKNSSNEVVTFSPDSDIDTLTEAPTSSTLIGLDGKPYKIGDEVRVADSSFSSGYKTYILMDINSNGEAVWKNVLSQNDYEKEVPNTPYYIIIDQTISEPTTMISENIPNNNRKTIDWIRKNTHRYLGGYVRSADTMYISQLSDYDFERFNDNEGSKAYVTGEYGNVFVRIPRFFYKAERSNVSSDAWKIGFNLTKIDDTWKEWDGNELIGMFEAGTSYFNDNKYDMPYGKIESVYNEHINYDTKYDNLKSKVENIGNIHFKMLTWKSHTILAFLFYALYLRTDVSNFFYISNITYTNSSSTLYYLPRVKGMNDSIGRNEYSQYLGYDSFLGILNFLGGGKEFFSNIKTNTTSSVTITEYDSITGENTNVREIPCLMEYGAISNLYVGEYLDAIPVSGNGSSTTSYFEYSNLSANTNTSIIYKNGLLSINSGYNTLSSGSTRLIYTGKIQEVDSSYYKSLYTINERGVFIETVDNELITKENWDGSKTANSVVVLTDDIKIGIALKIGSGYTYDENSITTSSSGSGDTNGLRNTYYVCSQSDTWTMCHTAASYAFPNGEKIGYVPSIGELMALNEYLSEIQQCLSVCGGEVMEGGEYAASTTKIVYNENDEIEYKEIYAVYYYTGTNEFALTTSSSRSRFLIFKKYSRCI